MSDWKPFVGQQPPIDYTLRPLVIVWLDMTKDEMKRLLEGGEGSLPQGLHSQLEGHLNLEDSDRKGLLWVAESESMAVFRAKCRELGVYAELPAFNQEELDAWDKENPDAQQRRFR